MTGGPDEAGVHWLFKPKGEGVDCLGIQVFPDGDYLVIDSPTGTYSAGHADRGRWRRVHDAYVAEGYVPEADAKAAGLIPQSWTRQPPGPPAIRGGPAVLGAGAVAGILDITAAITFWGLRGVAPRRILQAIASGLLGAAAFRGGLATAALGLALHFVIATGAAAVYYVASRFWPVLVRRAVVAGLAYGVVVYLVMHRVVLPLSAGTFRPPSWDVAAPMVVIHMLCVGLPIALVVRRIAGEPAPGWQRR